jgi:hypothetical protein
MHLSATQNICGDLRQNVCRSVAYPVLMTLCALIFDEPFFFFIVKFVEGGIYLALQL